MPIKPNPSVSTMHNDAAAIATLNIRVTGIEGRVSELSSTVNGVQTALSTKIDGLATSLGGKIEERSRQPWQLYVSVLIGIFSLYAYIDNSKIGPLKEKDADLIATIKEVSSVIRNDMVPARVHAREWTQNDEKIRGLEASIEDRVKRLDDGARLERTAIVDRIKRLEERNDQTWNQRDALTILYNRLDKLENATRADAK